MPFITMNSQDMSIPVLIPQTTTPAVTGINSNWLIAGAVAAALLASWGIWGSHVTRAATTPRGPGKPKKAVRAARK